MERSALKETPREKVMKFRVDLPQKLLAFLRDKCGARYSVKQIKRAIDGKRCLVNGKIERISTRLLQPGDRVEIDLAAEEIISPEILFEDAYLLIVDKPAGVISENAALNELLPDYAGQLLLIHRLDKETSGALMLAKSAEMKERMVELFREKKVSKTYHALVHGKVVKKKGKIESFLGKKGVHHGQTLWGSKEKGREQELAITLWECLKSGEKASLLLCQPITGRTHQLRVHLSEMGHPILGDTLYGKSFTFLPALRRQLLHATLLRFVHPITQKEVEIKAPLPEAFLQAQHFLSL